MIQKNNSYYNESLSVAKEFIQSITMVDDKAIFSNGTPIDSGYFDAGMMAKSFASQGVMCSIFKFTEEADVSRIASISQKSDITILDWRMLLSNGDNAEDDDDDLEEDTKESKGFYTLEILKNVIACKYNKFKLFIIYTEEIDFNRIVDEIENNLKSIGLEVNKDRKSFSILCNSNKITIFGKESLKSAVKHTQEIGKRSFTYDELPDAIYNEFVNLTHGVVSNILLKSITAIRANTFFLLNTFKRDVDAAFIAHKGLLPNPDDAHDHILELIGSEIKSIIGGALKETITNSQIESFIESLDAKELIFDTIKEELNNTANIPEKFTIDEFKDLLNCGIITKFNYENESVKSKNELSKKVIKLLPQIIIKGYNTQLSSVNVQSQAKRSNILFAKLTTIKTRYLNSSKPILTLGLILKGSTISGKDEYWICIQPKCDSVRLAESENTYQGRSFMFLSLTKTSSNGDIMLESNLGFKIEYSIIKSRQFMFRPTKKGMVVVKGDTCQEWFFLDSFGRRFEYVAELKNDFAQGIANNFASKISRVATNHSEWLRLNSIK